MRCSSWGVWIQKIRGILAADCSDWGARPSWSLSGIPARQIPLADWKPARDELEARAPIRVIREIRGELHAGRMPGYIAAGVAAIGIPARADISAAAQIGRVEAQTGDNRKGVSRAGINGDPAASAAFAIAHELARGQGRIESAGAVERKGNRSRTIVSAIIKRSVPAAPDVGFPAKTVRGPDRVLHALRRARRRVGHSVAQNGPASCNRRPISPPLNPSVFLLLSDPALAPVVIVIFLLERRCSSPSGNLISHAESASPPIRPPIRKLAPPEAGAAEGGVGA